MANTEQHGTYKVIGGFLDQNGNFVPAKTQQVHLITHFIHEVDERRVIVIDASTFNLRTPHGDALPSKVGIESKKGRKFEYLRNGYDIKLTLKKMVGTLVYNKVTPE